MSTSRRKRPAPFSIRLSDTERAALEREAAGQPLGAHIRAKLLNKRPAAAKSDPVMLARILGVLGKSELASRLCLLAVAAESGSLPVDDEVTDDLKQACADVREIRLILIRALGLRS